MAFLFDYDYTLADATVGIVASFNYALEQLGFPAAQEKLIKRAVGLPKADAFKMATGVTDKSLAGKFEELFYAKSDAVMAENTYLFPEAIPLLKSLKARGIKTGIVTSKHRYLIEETLRRYKAENLIDAIVGKEDVSQIKPNPEGILKILSRLSLAKEDVLFVGDSEIDAKAAAAADVDFVAVLTGQAERGAFLHYSYRYIAEDLSDFASYFGLMSL